MVYRRKAKLALMAAGPTNGFEVKAVFGRLFLLAGDVCCWAL